MAKPSGADYQQAFQNPRSAFLDPELQQAQPAKNRLGLPNLMSGNFAVVCHFSGDSETWAIRAFVKDVPDLQERYRLIADYLDGRCDGDSPFVGFRYVPDGVRVRGEIHPIVAMDWVPGVQLHRAVGERVHAGQSLKPLIDAWTRLVTDLESMGVAHGDLQHGNILADGDRLHLVDYDGMFVPGMEGLPFREQGHANYQHPERVRHGFNAELDRFSAILILVALKALDNDSSLWQRTGMPNDHLLFRHQKDFVNPARSHLFNELTRSDDATVRGLAGILRSSLINGGLPPLVSSLIGNQPTIVSSTSDPKGWWKGSQSEPVVGNGQLSSPVTPTIGSGWIRAYVGATVAPSSGSTDSQSGNHVNPLLDQVPFVASFNRTYVHRSACDWARQISPRNLIGFESLDEALASGYKPCKQCKPQLSQHGLFDAAGQARLAGIPTHSPMKWDTSKVRDHFQSSARTTSPPAQRSSSSQKHVVTAGSQVKLQYPKGDIVVVRIVSSGGSAATLSHVPEDSPLGIAIVGKRAGDEVVYREMGRVFRFTILEVN